MSTRRLFDTPVLVVDALGLSNEMKSTDGAELLRIVEKLGSAVSRLPGEGAAPCDVRSPVGHLGNQGFRDDSAERHVRRVLTAPGRESGAALFDCVHVAYQTFLLAQVISRGGLGYGSLVKSKDLMLGAGFFDAYETSEKRADEYGLVVRFLSRAA